MKTFITGATGFIGTHLVRRLAQTEHELYCLVRKTSNVLELEEAGAVLIRGDMTDKETLLEGMHGCDWVINLGATVSFWEPDKQTYTHVNVEGVRNVLEAALENGITKVLHVSSAVVYGEPADCPFTEGSPVAPVRRSEYARTKYAGDLLALELCEEKGLPLVMLHPGSVLGPDNTKCSSQQMKDFISYSVASTVSNDSVLTLVDVRDVAEAIVRALEKDNNEGERYLIGKHQLSSEEFGQLVSEICGVPLANAALPDCLTLIAAAFLGGTRMRFDGSKAERELGITYAPIRVSLKETIASHQARI